LEWSRNGQKIRSSALTHLPDPSAVRQQSSLPQHWLGVWQVLV